MQDVVPIKMYEYMACGKPIISTSLPGVMTEFGEGNGVFYVDGPAEILERAEELVEKRLIGVYGSKARKFVEKCSWEKTSNEFKNTLRKVILENLR